MTIINNNSISIQNGTLFLNEPGFDSKLFFTDDTQAYNYFIVREDTVLTFGILNGYDNGANYSYRFDFGNYIKITNQDIPEMTLIDPFGSVKFQGKNSSNVSLFIGVGDIVTQNITAGHLVKQSNGNIKLVNGHTINDLIATQSFKYKFIDKIPGDDILFDSTNVPMQNFYYVITNYSSTTLTIDYRDSTNNNLIPQLSVTKDNGNDYIVTMLKIHPKCTNVIINGVNHYTAKCNGGTDYFFWNYDGRFDRLNCTGNSKPTDTVTKSNIKVGNKVVYNKIDIVKQIKQNTGFELSENQMFGLIQSPNIIKLNDVDVTNINLVPGIFEENLTATSDVVYGNHNVYLTGGQTYKFKAKGSVASGGTLSIKLFDSTMATVSTITISTVSPYSYSNTFIAPTTGLYSILSTLMTGTQSTTNWVAVQLNVVSTDYKSVELVEPKQYSVDTTMFDSYIGKKYGEKNMELIFTDPKVQSRRTSFTTTFYS